MNTLRHIQMTPSRLEEAAVWCVASVWCVAGYRGLSLPQVMSSAINVAGDLEGSP